MCVFYTPLRCLASFKMGMADFLHHSGRAATAFVLSGCHGRFYYVTSITGAIQRRPRSFYVLACRSGENAGSAADRPCALLFNDVLGFRCSGGPTRYRLNYYPVGVVQMSPPVSACRLGLVVLLRSGQPKAFWISRSTRPVAHENVR